MNTRIIIAAVLLGLGSIPTAFAENNDNEDKATLSSAVTAESVGEAVKELASTSKLMDTHRVAMTITRQTTATLSISNEP